MGFFLYEKKNANRDRLVIQVRHIYLQKMTGESHLKQIVYL